ncbi:MAG: peptidylprolyl isomerase, partial [Candidatus Poseidoniaceae archaeon]|nr:peptidylprolyl isomerase [Candidatus Poseidoniaceae archaeon]
QGGDFENNDGTGGYAYQWYGYCDGEAMSQASDCSSETLYTLPDEANNNLTHLPCILSMAKTSAPHTGGSQFFIIPEDSTPYWLDGVHTVFGKVISGCEHVTTLSEVATDGNDRPVVPVIIVSATASE